MGANGIEKGTLGKTASVFFNDTAANVWVETQKLYDEMGPIYVDDSNKSIYIKTDIRTIPVNKYRETLFNFSQLHIASQIFYRCYDLEYIGPLDLSSCTDMSGMFFETNISKPIILNNINNVTTMSGLFAYSPNITSVTFSGTPILSTNSSLASLFDSKRYLKEVIGLDFTNVTNIVNLFLGDSNLETFIPVHTDIANIISMYQAFNGCSNLVNVPVFKTTYLGTGTGYYMTQQYAMKSAFLSCNRLNNNSLNNILYMCINAINITTSEYKTLKYIGLSQAQATVCQGLSNYSAFVNAGWTTGY